MCVAFPPYTHAGSMDGEIIRMFKTEMEPAGTAIVELVDPKA